MSSADMMVRLKALDRAVEVFPSEEEVSHARERALPECLASTCPYEV